MINQIRYRPVIILGVIIWSLISFTDLPRAEVIKGTIRDSGTGESLEGTVIQAVAPGGRVIAGTTTSKDGSFSLDVGEAESYEIVFSRLGYETLRITDVHSADLASVELLINLNLFFTISDTLVVSASRMPEPNLDAPASVSVIKRIKIDENVQFTPVDLAKDITGVDFATTGLIQGTYSVRGNRGTMSASMLSMTDNRYSSVPVLNFNIPYLIPYSSEDIERIEVVRGPASAIYGPDISQGVMYIQTRSPFDSEGLTVSLTGGEREVFQGTLRYAESWNDRVGFKVTGEYFRGRDWEYYDPFEIEAREDAIAGGADPDTLRIGNRDFDIQRVAGEARLDWRLSDEHVLSLRGGTAGVLNVIDVQSSVGAMQIRDCYNSFTQVLLEGGGLTANFFYNWIDFGDTYFLRTGDPMINKSSIQVLQLKKMSDLAERYRLTYGLDIRRSEPKTEGTIHGRYEDVDVMSEFGTYLSTTTRLTERFDLAAAIRLDYHDRINDLAVSPRAGLIFRVAPEQAVRFTFNRAFNSPRASDLFIDMSAMELLPGQDLRFLGIPKEGLTYDHRCGGEYCMYSPFNPAGPRSAMPADATQMWPLLQSLHPEIAAISAPDASQVGSIYRTFDIETFSFSRPADFSKHEPEERIITNSLEIGYKGSVGKRLSLAADLYGNRIENQYGEYYVANPSVFFDPGELEAYLVSQGVSQTDAETIAAEQLEQPMGTISPDQDGSADYILVVDQGGSLEYWGADIAAEFMLTERLNISGTYSYVDETVFHNEEFGEQIFSIPRNKASLGTTYRDLVKGIDGNIQWRWVESYPVASGMFRGDLETYNLLDIGIGYRFYWAPDMRISINAYNVFDNRHREFPRTPELGRMVVGRLQMTF